MHMQQIDLNAFAAMQQMFLAAQRYGQVQFMQ
jgi:hypothetical protein